MDHNSNSPSPTGAVIGIRKLFADPSGCRVVYIDDKADAFLYCPVCRSLHCLISWLPKLYTDTPRICNYDVVAFCYQDVTVCEIRGI